MSEISEAELFLVQIKWEAIPLPYAIFDFELSVFISITYKHSPIYLRSVGINLSIKISDFGLKNETNYYRMLKAKDCPIKWMSAEVLKDGISSEKSDVVRHQIFFY